MTCWGCLWWTFTVRYRRLNIECMLSEHSDNDKQDPTVRKFLLNSLSCMLLRYNGKEIINWLWFGSFWNIRLAYRIHHSWWTTHTTVLTNKNLGSLYKKVNQTHPKLCLSTIQTVTAFITCSSTPKALKWTPIKTNIWKWCKLFLSSGTVFREVTKEKGSGFCRI